VHTEPQILDLVHGEPGVSTQRRRHHAHGRGVSVLEREVEFDKLGRAAASARFGVGDHATATLQQNTGASRFDMIGLPPGRGGYRPAMLWTILIILAIIALVLFILGRRAV